MARPVAFVEIRRTRWDNRHVHKRVDEGAMKGVREAAEFVADKAKETTPIEDAELRENVQVKEGRDKGGNPEFQVVYDLPYAVRQHENATYKHDAPGRRKWLELTITENEREVRERFGRGVQEELKK